MHGINIEIYKSKIAEIRKHTSELSVLMAEDYLPLHESLNKLFKSIFKNVDTAFDGEEALKIYKEAIVLNKKYSLIFTDIEMPNMNGVEFAKEIKKINSDDTIVVHSAHQESKYLLDLINIGVRRFILKPSPLINLLEELKLIFEEINNNSNNKIIDLLILSDNVTYSKKSKSIYLDNNLIILTKYEQYIIELLVEKVNLTVSNDDIVDYLYLNMIDMNIDNVRKLMYKLRKKLPNEFIKSIHGIGYRITKEIGDK